MKVGSAWTLTAPWVSLVRGLSFFCGFSSFGWSLGWGAYFAVLGGSGPLFLCWASSLSRLSPYLGPRLTLSLDLSFLRAFGLPAAPGPSQSSKLMLSTLRRSIIFCTYRGLAPPLLGFRLSLLVDLFFPPGHQAPRRSWHRPVELIALVHNKAFNHYLHISGTGPVLPGLSPFLLAGLVFPSGPSGPPPLLA